MAENLYVLQPCPPIILPLNPTDYHRFITHYGEEHARLDVSQSIAQDDLQVAGFSAVLYDSISRTLFDMPNANSELLKGQFRDRVAYRKYWSPFIVTMWRDWVLSMVLVSSWCLCA